MFLQEIKYIFCLFQFPSALSSRSNLVGFSFACIPLVFKNIVKLLASVTLNLLGIFGNFKRVVF